LVIGTNTPPLLLLLLLLLLLRGHLEPDGGPRRAGGV
jgi:hypothetical protein